MPEQLVRLKTKVERIAGVKEIDQEIAALRAWRKQHDADTDAWFNERLMMLTKQRKTLLEEFEKAEKNSQRGAI